MSVGIHTSKGFVKVAGVSFGENPMIGATEYSNGKAGLVPAPAIKDKDKFLRGDGVWSEAASHEHDNKPVLDKLSESSNGVLLFNGNEIQGGSGADLSNYATIEFVNETMKNIDIDFENEDIDFSEGY